MNGQMVELINVSNKYSQAYEMVGQTGKIGNFEIGGSLTVNFDSCMYIKTSIVRSRYTLGEELHVATKNTNYVFKLLNKED